jgi:hypothetical protein
MGSWADECTRDDAQLLLTEVVSNGVKHAESPMSVELNMEHDMLRAEVSDDSPREPMRRVADEFGGRGVQILDALASRWGVLGHPGDGKTVWFELAGSAVPEAEMALAARHR